MKHDIKTIVSTKEHKGKKFWVCDYRKDSLHKKANRNVPPTEIIVLTDEDFDEAGIKVPTVYYSCVAFSVLNKKGEPKYSKLIPPYDTTGYRSYPGIGINVFDTEDECIEFYNEQVKVVQTMYENHISTVISSLEYELEEIKKKYINKD